MTFDTLRHIARYVVNGLAFAVALLSLPELGYVVPVAWLPGIMVVTAFLNTLLSYLRVIPR